MMIYCIQKDPANQHWFSGTYWCKQNILTEVKMSEFVWIDRSSAETNTAFKQIIPYVIVTTIDELYACYQRKGAEQRLHELWSCGIGGHVDIIDKKDTVTETILSGVRRELAEEFEGLNPNKLDLKCLGTIHEDQTEVGLHHVGIVFHFVMLPDDFIKPSDELHNFQWISYDDIKMHRCEIWTQLALELHKDSLCRLR